ncbi:MAG: thioredoxin-dependent thiol peroxidase [Patescibacteria group bacterium]
MLKIGQKAPEFTLPDQDGKLHSLADYKGKRVLLYFYPKDDTPGCTTEACAIRDTFGDFQKMGLVVLGVSGDDVKSHKKFAEKYKLPFPLLADMEKKVLKAYGAWGKKKFMPARRSAGGGGGKEHEGILRTSFLIGEDGKILKVYENVKPPEHAAEVLAGAK